jgi:alpha-N-arabinofuranosidase
MYRSIITKCFTGIFMITLAVQVKGQVRAEVHVDTDTPLHRINPGIFGHIIEHYGRVVEHGLWAELLENRKFYPFEAIGQMNIAVPWTGDPKDKETSYAIDRSVSVDGVSSQRLVLTGESPHWRGIRQDGFDVVGGREYIGHAWIKSTAANQSAAFALETPEGVMLAQVAVPLTPGDWQRCDFKLTPTSGLHPAVFRIMFNHAGVVWIGAASLMPGDNIDGIRKDVVELARSMAPPLVRWPGGGFADTYDWRIAIGPRDKRPPHPLGIYANDDGYDSRVDPSDFGIDEFIHFCRLIGAQPYINANFGSGSPEQAREWVEYCNGPASSEWGGRRAANGHPEPYNVKTWCVGNETWLSIEPGHSTPEGYAVYFNEFADAMHKADPEIKIVAVGDTLGADGNWNETVAKISGGRADYLSLHYYFALGFLSQFDADHPVEFYRSVEAAPVYVEQALRETLAKIDAATPGDKKIQIALDEWNDANFGPTPRTPPREFSLARLVQGLIKYADFNQPESDAVFEARMFHAFMRVGDRVPFACRTHMVNSTGAIRASSTDAYVTASGVALQLYGPHSGTKLLKLEQKSPAYDVPAYNWKNIPYLDACATLSEDGHKLYLHLINLEETQTMSVQIGIAGHSIEPQGDLWQIASESFLTLNNFGISPVKVRHQQLNGLSGEFVQQMPPHSATTLELTIK